MTEEEFKQYVSTTQSMLGRLNEHLVEIREAIQTSAKAHAGMLTVAACAQDASYLTIRALAETNVEFRTILLRLAQEPAPNPAAQESRSLLSAALAEHQRIAGERPQLKPGRLRVQKPNYSVKRTPVRRFRSSKRYGRRRLPQALGLKNQHGYPKR